MCTSVTRSAQEGGGMTMCTGAARRAQEGTGGQRHVCVYHITVIGLAKHSIANLCMHRAIL